MQSFAVCHIGFWNSLDDGCIVWCVNSKRNLPARRLNESATFLSIGTINVAIINEFHLCVGRIQTCRAKVNRFLPFPIRFITFPLAEIKVAKEKRKKWQQQTI